MQVVGTSGLTTDKRLIQMIASTCLLIAAKFADRKLPPLSELEKVHHGRANADEFAALELKILQALRWKLHVPLPQAFIEHLHTICVGHGVGAPFNPTIEDRILFFVDLSVYGAPALRIPPPAGVLACSIRTRPRARLWARSLVCVIDTAVWSPGGWPLRLRRASRGRGDQVGERLHRYENHAPCAAAACLSRC